MVVSLRSYDILNEECCIAVKWMMRGNETLHTMADLIRIMPVKTPEDIISYAKAELASRSI